MKNEYNSPIIRGIAIALVVLMLFSSGYLAGTLTSTSSDSGDTPAATPSGSASAGQQASPSASGASSTGDTTEEFTSNVEMTTAEIIQIFNDGAGKVKSEAVKVVKNYEYRKIDRDKLVAPSALQGMAETLIPQFMSDDTEPIEYATAQDIRDNFQVPKQDYVSLLTEADVERALIYDNGTEYEIEIEVFDEENPTAGTGVGSCFDVIETSEVSDAVTFVENFSTRYFDCVVKCKIDKATGRMVWANYTTPLTLDVTVNLLGTHNASITMSFEKDYIISY